MKANDLDAMMRCYAPDAVAWLPEFRKRAEKRRSGNRTGLSWRPTDVEDVKFSDARYEAAGDRALAWGKFQLTLVPRASGKPVTMSGRFSEVAEKKNGRWVYVVDHASAEPAPATAPYN